MSLDCGIVSPSGTIVCWNEDLAPPSDHGPFVQVVTALPNFVFGLRADGTVATSPGKTLSIRNNNSQLSVFFDDCHK